MEATLLAKTQQFDAGKQPENMVEFYENATIDYEYWSKDLHMHYGYTKSPFQSFNLASMLEQMTIEVGERLKIKKFHKTIDFGCGMGASLRTLARLFPNSDFYGLNVVDAQIQRAKKENIKAHLQKNIRILKADFHQVPLPQDSMDSAFAIESYCHAADKRQVLREMSRVVKPGGRIVLADCFLKKHPEKLFGCAKYAYNQMNALWHVPELPQLEQIKANLLSLGYKDIRVKNINLHVAPSVFYSPFKVVAFQWKNRKKTLDAARKNNIHAVLMACLLALHVRQVGYYMIDAVKE